MATFLLGLSGEYLPFLLAGPSIPAGPLSQGLGGTEGRGGSNTNAGQDGEHTREAEQAPSTTEPWASTCAPHGEKGALIRRALHPSLAGCLGL